MKQIQTRSGNSFRAAQDVLRNRGTNHDTNMKFLGIDVGTGGTRALVVDTDGRVTASATVEHVPFASPQTGWAEQDPRDWWRASTLAVRQVLASEKAAHIGAVGLSGQMHGAVLLDARNEALRASIIWCDQRTGAQCRSITEKIGAEKLIEYTSNPALTGFTLPKLLWVREFEPEIWREVRSVMLPKDYVRLRLSGEKATDAADASGTLLFDVVGRKWSQHVLSATEIDERLLPRVYESPEVTGTVSRLGAEATGLNKGTLIIGGSGDQAAGAVGMGIVRAGTVSATIGTSGVVFAATDKPALDPKGRVHTFCHAVPGRWHVMGVTQGAGLSLRWFRDQFGAGAGDGSDPYERLTEEAASVPAGASGLIWTPYLMGERTPHLDPRARAALVGLTASHTRAHVVRAILEVQADVYGRAVKTVQAEEGAAYGAALLAGVGAGAWPSVDSACDAIVRIASTVEPNSEYVTLLDRQYKRFQRVYPALKPLEVME
jgi:xylulokinase